MASHFDGLNFATAERGSVLRTAAKYPLRVLIEAVHRCLKGIQNRSEYDGCEPSAGELISVNLEAQCGAIMRRTARTDARAA